MANKGLFASAVARLLPAADTLNRSAAPAYAHLLYLPGLYLSGVFFPLPKSMYFQAPWWPQFHLNQLLFAAGGVDKFRYIGPEMAFAVLLGFTVLCSGIAMVRLKRRG